MIVADGRTDLEKLRELLAEPEQDGLDFKSRIDLDQSVDKLNLVKDLLALGNNPDGGYLLIGIDDSGKLCLPTGSITDRRVFDAARIGDLVSKYVEGVQSFVTQIHELDDHEAVIIFAQPHSDGFPLPTSSLGQYEEKGGRQKIIFRPGEVFVREGAKNVHLRHAHFTQLLARHDEAVRAETSKHAYALLSRLAKTPSTPGNVLLDMDMPDEAFAETVRLALDTGAKPALSRFIGQASQTMLTNSEHFTRALHKITIVAVEALGVNKKKMASRAVDAIYQAYLKLPCQPPPAEAHLALATNVYVIGSMAVRMAVRKQMWQVVRDIALRPSPDTGINGYVYSSWIRHMQVSASRGHLIANDDNGALISAARKLMSDFPCLRPDVVGEVDLGNPSSTESVLNSLCQFDFMYCIWVFAEGKHRGEAYPWSSAFNQNRLNPVLSEFGDSEMREALFPGVSDTALATALKKVSELASQQSMQVGQLWELSEGRATKFLSETLQSD